MGRIYLVDAYTSRRVPDSFFGVVIGKAKDATSPGSVEVGSILYSGSGTALARFAL
jgi:hypothetical protein